MQAFTAILGGFASFTPLSAAFTPALSAPPESGFGVTDGWNTSRRIEYEVCFNLKDFWQSSLLRDVFQYY
jgi:hypothetical protein